MIQQKTISPDTALERLERLCARAEHCESELTDKLRRWGVGSADSLRIMDSLRGRRYVDDTRFARAFVRDKYRFARWGRAKIRMALAAKRIARDSIAEALDEIEDDIYTENLRHIIAAKQRSLGAEAESYEGRTKVYRFALSRGYESALIARLLKKD